VNNSKFLVIFHPSPELTGYKLRLNAQCGGIYKDHPGERGIIFRSPPSIAGTVMPLTLAIYAFFGLEVYNYYARMADRAEDLLKSLEE